MTAFSSTNTDRLLNIFAAVVMKNWVLLIVDFARIVTMRVVSRDRHWVAEDFEYGSKVNSITITSILLD